jgi:hypothetical protein
MIPSRVCWTNALTKKLEDTVQEMGIVDMWARVASKLGNNLTAKQCRDKWHVLYKDLHAKREWSVAEDMLLLQLAEESRAWKSMEQHFVERTAKSLCQHWYSLRDKKEEPTEEKKEEPTEEKTVLTEPIFPLDFEFHPWQWDDEEDGYD